jgi:hypothetical protein
MKQSEIFRENADNCAHLAEGADSEPVFNRYKRMEAAWRALCLRIFRALTSTAMRRPGWRNSILLMNGQ